MPTKGEKIMGGMTEKYEDDMYPVDPEDNLEEYLLPRTNPGSQWRAVDKSFSKVCGRDLAPKTAEQVEVLKAKLEKIQRALISECAKCPDDTLLIPIWRRTRGAKAKWETLPGAVVLANKGDTQLLIERTHEQCSPRGVCANGYPRVFLTALPGKRAQPTVRNKRGNCLSLVRLLRDLPELTDIYPNCRWVSQKRLGFHYLAHTPMVLYRSHVVPMTFKHGAKATRPPSLLDIAAQYQSGIEAMNRSPLDELAPSALNTQPEGRHA